MPNNDTTLEGNVVRGSEVREVEAPSNPRSFFHGKPPRLWCLGNPAILNHTLLGIFSARQIDSDLALKSSQLLKHLVFSNEISFIGGWHSPLEAEALRILVDQPTPIVICVSKSFETFVCPKAINDLVIHGQAVLLTHCSPNAKRITRDASLRRNQLVVELAAVLLVLSAPEGSASLKLARSALRKGKTVYTLEHRLNKDLLLAGAVPATCDKIKEALR